MAASAWIDSILQWTLVKSPQFCRKVADNLVERRSITASPLSCRIHAADAFGFTSNRWCVTMFFGCSTLFASLGAASGMLPVSRRSHDFC